MSVLAGTLAVGRRQAEARMLDTGKAAGVTVTVDPDTLATVEVEAVRYTGKHRISTRSGAVSERDAAGQSVATQDLILSLPIGAAALRTDDVWTVTAVDPATGDPATVGRKYRVTGLASGSQTTAVRYPIELSS